MEDHVHLGTPPLLCTCLIQYSMIGDQHSDMLAARLGRIEERILVSKDVCPSFDNFTHNYKTLNDFYKDKFLMADEDALG